MKRLILLLCLIFMTSSAETFKEKAVGFVTWKFEKSASLSVAERTSSGQSLFDTDRISSNIRREGRAQGLSSPIPKQVADDFVRGTLAQPSPEATVKIIDVKVAEMPESTSVLIWFKAFPANGGLPEEMKSQFRQFYLVNPRPADSLAREYPSIPASALVSADTLISYMEEKAAGNPPTHEYEFIFDNQTGLITDWKILFREGSPRKSQFLNLVDNIQKARESGY